MGTQYYLFVADERCGPFPKEVLLDRGLRPDTLVWYRGCGDWKPARDVPELADLFDEPPPLPRRPQLRTADDDPGPRRRLRVGVPYPPEALERPYRPGVWLYGFGLGVVLVGALMLLFAMFIDWFIARDRSLQPLQDVALILAIGAGIVGVPCLGIGSALLLMVIYRAWAVVQDGQARATPAMAVGLLFVPLFNLFWVFVALAGLAKDLNQFARRHGLDAPPASESLGFAVSLYHLLTVFPFLGQAAFLLNLFAFPFFVRSVSHAAAGVCRAWPRRRPPALEREPDDILQVDGAGGLVLVATFLAPFAAGLFVGGLILSAYTVGEYVVRHRNFGGLVAGLVLLVVGLLLQGVCGLLAFLGRPREEPAIVVKVAAR